MKIFFSMYKFLICIFVESFNFLKNSIVLRNIGYIERPSNTNVIQVNPGLKKKKIEQI